MDARTSPDAWTDAPLVRQLMDYWTDARIIGRPNSLTIYCSLGLTPPKTAAGHLLMLKIPKIPKIPGVPTKSAQGGPVRARGKRSTVIRTLELVPAPYRHFPVAATARSG